MNKNVKAIDNLDAFRKELKELNEPYSDEELELHMQDRDFKSCLEMIHAHNWKLIGLTQKWQGYLQGKNARPVKKISKYVDPNAGPDINNACGMIGDLVALMVEYGEGNCPKARIIIQCSHSTATLIDRLDKIKHSVHLHRASCAISKLFYFMTYYGEPTMSPEKYQQQLTDITAEFIKCCIANAEELADFTADAVRKIEGNAMGNIYERNSHPITLAEAETLLGKGGEKLDQQSEVITDICKAINRIDKRDKKRKRKGKFTDRLLNVCQHYWELSQHNEKLKASIKSKLTHQASFLYYKRELTAEGIVDAKMYSQALTRRSKQISQKKSTS